VLLIGLKAQLPERQIIQLKQRTTILVWMFIITYKNQLYLTASSVGEEYLLNNLKWKSKSYSN
tara:strand:- start:624 stop:812 length:189 start_codon:yes stop_codon:yes gene_type:complete